VLTLTPAELREFTSRRRSDAQARVLEHMGVPFSRRPDGSLVVLRAVAERLLGGDGTMQRREPELQP
jgi:succinate dehydrogenase/fumarate reductase flavoprotein subunit